MDDDDPTARGVARYSCADEVMKRAAELGVRWGGARH